MHSIKDIVKQLIGKSLDAYNTNYTKVLNTRIDNIVAQAGNDNTEIVDARIDSAGVTHTTLNNRILAETKMNDEQLVEYTGRDISAEDTTQGYLKDVEILGNTIQNEEDLSDIKSVGVLQEDGTYKMSILSCGKNLFNPLSNDIVYALHGGVHKKVTYKVEGDKIIIKSNPSVNSDWGFIDFKNIKVTPNKSYTIHPNATVIKGNVCVFVFDGNNTKLFEIPNTSKTFIPTTKHITIRLYVQTTTLYTDAEIHYKPQLEEGTQATPYEPYQGNKCDILLPCQLEKVGNVSDRLYYDDVEKAWCIEKNIETIILNGSETWLKYPNWDTVNTMLFYLDYNAYKVYNKHVAKKEYTECKSNLFNYSPRTDFVNLADKEKIIMYGANTGGDINITTCSPQISILKSKLPTQDVTGFKTWLSQNPTLVKYQLATPQKIVLPLSTQITLNSFFGTTHVYMESGDVEGTIKCKIPKSLGATVQSLNNKTDILSDRIEAIEGLKDSQNMKYETDKGYLVCKETKNGVIDDLKIEGRTLVNLAEQPTNNGSINNQYATISKVTNIKPSTEYTYIIHNNGSETLKLYLNNNGGFDWFELDVEANSTVIGKAKTLPAIDGDIWLSLNKTETVEQNLQVVLLEGDHTQNPPSYFEGLMSVGQDVDEIEVLSCNENLLNLVDLGYTQKGQYLNIEYMNANSIKLNTLSENPTPYASVSFDSFKFIPNIRYRLKAKCTQGNSMNRPFISIRQYENYGSGLKDIYAVNGVIEGTFIPTHTNHRIDIYGGNHNGPLGGTWVEYTDIQLSIDNSDFNYFTTHQSDKKQILFYNENGELEPVTELHEWDSIEKHSDNKWYYHKRSGKVVLNGSESGWNVNTQTDTTMRFEINMVSKNMAGNRNPIICDKFNLLFNYELNCVEEGVFTSIKGSTLFLNILKSKLSTQDIEGFKQWLQTNNVTAVYQLAEEEVYELAPLHLDSYANETLILCNSGAISPKMEFSITSHINELVKAYGERINLLEEKVYQYMVTQNRMQLASTYSADSVTFKVDYFSLCGNEENYDEDLYNLILNNILVGKDNYNYDKMFTMILDYASWNQISWEQFDILVGLMDIQRNPPVEELPTEDEIEENI